MNDNVIQLPPYATMGHQLESKIPIVIVTADLMYPFFLSRIKSHVGKDIPIDAYWLEVAYQSMKLHLQEILGQGISIYIQDVQKKWAQKKFPSKRDPRLATKSEGKMVYRQIRHLCFT